MPIVPVRVTDEQKAWLDAQAGAAGLDVSKYVRQQLGLTEHPVIARLDAMSQKLDKILENTECP